MQCPKCGWSNPDDAVKCANCFAELKVAGPPQPTQQMPQPPQQPYAAPQQPYGQQPYVQGPIQAIPDYLVWAIVVTVISVLCCWCLPVPIAFGIVAIVKCSQASNKKALGDYIGALRDANASKTWIYWAAALDAAGLIAWIIYGVFIIIGATHAAHNTSFP